MGCIENITATKFPKQGKFFGKIVDVCFHYDVSQKFRAKIIRADSEEPFLEILQLDDGRVVLSTECQYGYPADIITEDK